MAIVSRILVRIEGKDDLSDDSEKGSKSLKRLDTAANGVKKALALLTVVAVALGFALRAVLIETNEDAEAFQRLETVIRSMGRETELNAETQNAFATALDRVTTASNQEILSVQALLISFAGLRAEIVDRTTVAVVNLATFLQTDVRSAAIQLGKALDNPTIGISALREAGISFTEQQKAVIQVLVDTNETLEAQSRILTVIESQVGEQAAIRTFADRATELGQAFDDVKVAIGEAITENAVFNQNIQDLTEFLRDSVDEIAEFAEGIADVVVGFEQVIGTLIKGTNSFARFFDQVERGIPFFDELKAVTTGFFGPFSALSSLSDAAGESFDELQRRGAALRMEFEDLAEEGTDWGNVLDEIALKAGKTTETLDGMDIALVELDDIFLKFGIRSLPQVRAEIVKTEDILQRLNDATENVSAEGLPALEAAIQRANDELEKLQDELTGATEELGEFAEAEAEACEEGEELIDCLDREEQEFEKLQETVVQTTAATNGLTNAQGQLIQTVIAAGNALRANTPNFAPNPFGAIDAEFESDDGFDLDTDFIDPFGDPFV